jgi:hypothetical protein
MQVTNIRAIILGRAIAVVAEVEDKKRLSRNWLSHHARPRFLRLPHSHYLGKSASNCLTFGSPCHADHRASNDVFADGNGPRGARGVLSKAITGGRAVRKTNCPS